MSPLFEENTTKDLSGDKATFSTSNSPGLNIVSAPPCAEIAYRCIHPSFSEGKSKRFPATHCQKSSPWIPGNESLSVSPERQISLASPLCTSATMMAHGCRRSRSLENVSLTLNNRMKATRFPSGDQRGAVSRSIEGERNRKLLACASEIAIKL